MNGIRDRIVAASSRLVPPAAAILPVFAPAAAYCCPTCFAASGTRGIQAYYLSTVLLTMMPFLLIGVTCAIAYAVRKSRARSARTESPGIPAAD
jgi:hypothetical protein